VLARGLPNTTAFSKKNKVMKWVYHLNWKLPAAGIFKEFKKDADDYEGVINVLGEEGKQSKIESGLKT